MKVAHLLQSKQKEEFTVQTHTNSPKTSRVMSFWTYYPKIWYSELEKTAETGHGVKKFSHFFSSEMHDKTQLLLLVLP